LLVALHLVFGQAHDSGIRSISWFLELSQLAHFITPSYGSQQNSYSVDVIQCVSDEALALISHAQSHLRVHNSSDDFHVVYEVSKATSLALNRQAAKSVANLDWLPVRTCTTITPIASDRLTCPSYDRRQRYGDTFCRRRAFLASFLFYLDLGRRRIAHAVTDKETGMGWLIVRHVLPSDGHSILGIMHQGVYSSCRWRCR
jgi:hypothetical protein